MKILLVGDYSGVHSNLAKSLRERGHEVLVVSDGDSYKNFLNDINIKYHYISSSNYIFKSILLLYYTLIEYMGIKGLIQIIFHYNKIKKLNGFDTVQLINPVALEGFGSITNILFINYLKNNNNNMFLCALGDDYFWVESEIENEGSMLSNINVYNFRKFLFPLRYKYGLFFPLLNKKAIEWSRKIIPGLYDYYKVYKDNIKCTEIIPIIIEYDENISPYKFTSYPINIFHGWQKGKELRKGNFYFDEAVKNLPLKYQKLINYNVVKSVPYKEYIESFSNSVIFFDQCFSYDKGVNALLGMAAGKVVFSGNQDNEKSICSSVINTKADVGYISTNLIRLIDNPQEIERLSKQSILYIQDRHNTNNIIESYIRIWNS